MIKATQLLLVIATIASLVDAKSAYNYAAYAASAYAYGKAPSTYKSAYKYAYAADYQPKDYAYMAYKYTDAYANYNYKKAYSYSNDVSAYANNYKYAEGAYSEPSSYCYAAYAKYAAAPSTYAYMQYAYNAAYKYAQRA